MAFLSRIPLFTLFMLSLLDHQSPLVSFFSSTSSSSCSCNRHTISDSFNRNRDDVCAHTQLVKVLPVYSLYTESESYILLDYCSFSSEKLLFLLCLATFFLVVCVVHFAFLCEFFFFFFYEERIEFHCIMEN